jgi:protein gp37
MSKTTIEWCDATINPFPGCRHVSDGCRFCYAERRAWRLRAAGIDGYADVVDQNGWTGRIGCRIERVMAEMRKIKPGSRVFVQSMGDLFFEAVPFGWIEILMRFIEGLWQDRTFLILTKRPSRAIEFFIRRPDHDKTNSIPRNMWLGVSIEDDKTIERAYYLRQIPAMVTFASCEPWLGPLDEGQMRALIDGIDWLICGSETGPFRRDRHVSQIGDFRKMFRLCAEAKTAFFCKSVQQGAEVVTDPRLLAALILETPLARPGAVWQFPPTAH